MSYEVTAICEVQADVAIFDGGDQDISEPPVKLELRRWDDGVSTLHVLIYSIDGAVRTEEIKIEMSLMAARILALAILEAVPRTKHEDAAAVVE